MDNSDFFKEIHTFTNWVVFNKFIWAKLTTYAGSKISNAPQTKFLFFIFSSVFTNTLWLEGAHQPDNDKCFNLKFLNYNYNKI